MRNLSHRLGKLERELGNRPCLACATTPHCFLLRNDEDWAEYRRYKREQATHCTCGRTFWMKVIILPDSA